MNGNIENMQSLTGRIKALAIDTTLTKKGMCAEAKATGEALATKVNITDIVDDLTSVADDKPLSANQGRVLKKQIDEIDPHYAENVLYNDTNVKDALDKVSKAENIAYNEKSVKGAIDELNENVEDVQTQIEGLICKKYISGTTDAYGAIYLGADITLAHIPLVFVSNQNNYIANFFIANTHQRYVQFRAYSDTYAVCGNKSVTGTLYYINPNYMKHS